MTRDMLIRQSRSFFLEPTSKEPEPTYLPTEPTYLRNLSEEANKSACLEGPILEAHIGTLHSPAVSHLLSDTTFPQLGILRVPLFVPVLAGFLLREQIKFDRPHPEPSLELAATIDWFHNRFSPAATSWGHSKCRGRLARDGPSPRVAAVRLGPWVQSEAPRLSLGRGGEPRAHSVPRSPIFPPPPSFERHRGHNTASRRY